MNFGGRCLWKVFGFLMAKSENFVDAMNKHCFFAKNLALSRYSPLPDILWNTKIAFVYDCYCRRLLNV